MPIKVSEGGSLSLTYISEGLRYAIDQNVDVINLSLGWKRQSTIKAIENEIQGLIEEAVQKGITVIAAAGNGDNNGVRESTAQIYPVSYNDVIGVAALNSKLITKENNVINYQSYVAAKNSDASNLIYTNFSNYGDAIDYSAPGEFIICLTPTGSVFGNCGIVQGTSHSAPHLAATVATIKSYKKDLSLEQINKILQYYSLDLGTEGRDNDYGYGMPCFKNFQECNCNCANCIKIYCTGCECQNCVYNQVAEKILEKIEVTTNPNKTEYEEGEKFDKTGMVVTAVYSDNSKETVTDYTYTPTGSLTANDKRVIITYKGKTTTISISVKKIEKVLERLEITAPPSKTTYKEGEKFDSTGMVVTAIYSDGTREIITNYNCFPVVELTTSNDKITVSYTYQGKTVTQTYAIEVKAKQSNNNNSGSNDNSGNNNNNTGNNNGGNSNNDNTIGNNNMNFITVKDNTNNSNNNTSIPKNTNTDNTIKGGTIANTGLETIIIIPIAIITIIGTVAFINYKRYKDI